MRMWPSIAGAALAGFVAFGMSDAARLAPILAAAGFVYLGAAALQRPSTAWPLFFVTFAIIALGRSELAGLDPTWVLIGLSALLVGYGLLRGATRPLGGLPLQTIAMVIMGGMAAAALTASGDTGAYLVAGALLGHAAWDLYHHRTNKVVPRSMAEFCCVLDTLLAAAIIVVTAT